VVVGTWSAEGLGAEGPLINLLDDAVRHVRRRVVRAPVLNERPRRVEEEGGDGVVHNVVPGLHLLRTWLGEEHAVLLHERLDLLRRARHPHDVGVELGGGAAAGLDGVTARVAADEHRRQDRRRSALFHKRQGLSEAVELLGADVGAVGESEVHHRPRPVQVRLGPGLTEVVDEGVRAPELRDPLLLHRPLPRLRGVVETVEAVPPEGDTRDAADEEVGPEGGHAGQAVHHTHGWGAPGPSDCFYEGPERKTNKNINGEPAQLFQNSVL